MSVSVLVSVLSYWISKSNPEYQYGYPEDHYPCLRTDMFKAKEKRNVVDRESLMKKVVVTGENHNVVIEQVEWKNNRLWDELQQMEAPWGSSPMVSIGWMSEEDVGFVSKDINFQRWMVLWTEFSERRMVE
ncbi:hypothetical protein V6N12_013366 [Hibiscus sabdariffa]|uniref:Uncharacterized protein n=1 Tax=Hibiscus sabdariffa TaxID=183260 RepID=A0ABR2D6C9_9ROSI